MSNLSDKNINHFNLNTDDFNHRWQSARISALHKLINSPRPEKTKVPLSLLDEANLISQYFSPESKDCAAGSTTELACEEENTHKKDVLLRNVFDNSRRLAVSLSKFLGLSFELDDFKSLLETSGIPCAQGGWESRDRARVLVRKGCDFCPKAGAAACDYWREAIDGLVMGIGENVRLARHESIRHGDRACVDVFFMDSLDRSGPSLAWGQIPEHMAENIEKICTLFESNMKVSILIKGINEGVLYFEFKSSTDKHCSSGNILTATFQRKIQSIYPGLLVQDITPRAVLGLK